MPHNEISRIKVARALAWYHDNIAQGATLEKAAARVSTSAVHLRRLFHQVLGESPTAAVNRIRMDMAADLLRHTDLTLDVIAPMVGLSSGSSLSRAVKAHFGRLPGEMRKSGT
jgi:transcriptional regulator GlxA family with amidase domain